MAKRARKFRVLINVLRKLIIGGRYMTMLTLRSMVHAA